MSGPSNHPAAAYPTWLPRPLVPVTVIVGPPGNGAALYAESHRQAGEAIVCVNRIIAEISGGQGNPGDWIVQALARRNEQLAALADPAHIERQSLTGAWLIAASPRQWQRDFWSRQLGADILLLDPGKPAAIAGAAAAGVPVKYVHQWYAEAADTLAGMVMPPERRTPPPRDERPIERREASSKRGYGREHRVLRDEQLLREPYCRMCWEERGMKTPATVLDHILPFRRPDGSIDFKRWGDRKNHRSLCQACHDARGAQSTREEKPAGAGADGRPLDPNHPWNRGQ